MAALNSYGDSLVPTSGDHGSDISSQRLDDLDIASIDYLLHLLSGDNRGLTCYDVGCGLGFQGFRFSLLGAPTILVDKSNSALRITRIAQDIGMSLIFDNTDLRELSFPSTQSNIILYSQRTLHYITYSEVCDFLIRSRHAMLPRSRLFLSFSGLDSELGDSYPGLSLPIAERFHLLSPSNQERHQIRAPVCLYRLSDMATLAHDCDLTLISSWTSVFGNIKAILSP